MKTRFTFLCLLFTSLIVFAQERTTIAFLPMSYDESSISKHEAKMIHETVINGFVSSKKFTVVDREKLEDLEKEKSLQRTEAFIDSDNTVSAGLSKGANYLVDPSVMSLRNSELKRDKWETSILIQVRVLDVSTGEILVTESVTSDFTPTSKTVKKIMKDYLSKEEMKRAEAREEQLLESSKFPEEAFGLALVRLGENINKLTSSLFPFAADILQWDPKKKDEFVLTAGHNAGLIAGQVIDVVRKSTITIGDNEIQRSEVLGTAWIIRIDDQNFSRATVIDNHKIIRKAIKDGEEIGVLIR